MQPLTDPKAGSGLLGSWWRGSGGTPPSDWIGWAVTGAETLWAQPLWTCSWLLFLAALACILGEARGAHWEPGTRWTGIAVVVAGLATACLFGTRLEIRYLAPALVASLPWAGAWTPSWSSVILAWPTLALLTQLSAYRAELDPLSAPPSLPKFTPPRVNVQPLFENASTPNATDLREEAYRLADELEPGQVYRLKKRAHGREGELLWPLKVLRTDLEIIPDPVEPEVLLIRVAKE
jgi:hypothetical protein